jgi:hypothetical protein
MNPITPAATCIPRSVYPCRSLQIAKAAPASATTNRTLSAIVASAPITVGCSVSTHSAYSFISETVALCALKLGSTVLHCATRAAWAAAEAAAACADATPAIAAEVPAAITCPLSLARCCTTRQSSRPAQEAAQSAHFLRWASCSARRKLPVRQIAVPPAWPVQDRRSQRRHISGASLRPAVRAIIDVQPILLPTAGAAVGIATDLTIGELAQLDVARLCILRFDVGYKSCLHVFVLSGPPRPNPSIERDRYAAPHVSRWCVNVAPMGSRFVARPAPAFRRECPVRRVAVFHDGFAKVLLHNLAAGRFGDIERHPSTVNVMRIAAVKQFVHAHLVSLSYTFNPTRTPPNRSISRNAARLTR